EVPQEHEAADRVRKVRFSCLGVPVLPSPPREEVPKQCPKEAAVLEAAAPIVVGVFPRAVGQYAGHVNENSHRQKLGSDLVGVVLGSTHRSSSFSILPAAIAAR